MNPDEVVAWREALIRLSDQYFFDLVRMYLGAVKTPFNKQRLVEQLSAFLRKKENRSALLLRLDEFDVMILSAIAELPSPTQQKIVSLFSGSHSFPEIYDRILNLEERLVIYRKNATDYREYALNPLLKDDIAPLLGFSRLAACDSRGEPVAQPNRVDDLALAALYSLFLHSGESVKNDGTLRKKTRESLSAALPQLSQHPDCLPLLLAALQNLGLLVTLEGNLVPDPARWQLFSRIGTLERIAWLASAAGGRFTRDMLQQRAQVFLDFFAALEEGALYKRDSILRLSFLLAEKSGRASSGRSYGRFASILREKDAAVTERVAESELSPHPQADAVRGLAPSTASSFAEIAIAFGLVVETEGMWTKNAAFRDSSDGRVPGSSIVVSPSFSVTLMPGFGLAELLPLAGCMEARDVQIVAQFEITRRSCASAFEQGETAETLGALLKKRSSQPIPQNVLFSIDDWYRSYTSVSLYHGFVLRVDEGRRVLFENNEHLSSLILRTLAPGVYLLDAGSPAIIQEAFSNAGLEPPPAVSNVAPKRDPVPLPPLLSRMAGSSSVRASEEPLAPADASASQAFPSSALDAFRKDLYDALDALGLSPELADALRSRIDRRIVLNAAQLDPESVRIERVEAKGMDFLGKVRIAEYAIVSGSLLEVAYDEKEGNRVILGRPVSTEKRTGDVLLKIVTEQDHELELVSLGKAILVRRIRGSIFSELPAGRA